MSSIRWYWKEKDILKQGIPEDKMEIQLYTPGKKGGSKQFATATLEEVYMHVKKA